MLVVRFWSWLRALGFKDKLSWFVGFRFLLGFKVC